MSSRKRFAIRAALALALVAQMVEARPLAQNQPAAQRVSKAGVVESINGRTVVLKSNSGAEVTVTLPEDARLVRLEPGQTDLVSAPAITLEEVQVGDRMLVRGKPGDTAESLVASMAVLMKQADVAMRQQKEMQDWQRRGAGGIVSAIDLATNSATISVRPGTSVVVKTGKDTKFLRYSPNSVKFTDAQKGTFDQIKVGDQLRARGTRSADGKELAAEEVISGSFRNIAGTISGIDAAAKTIKVKDILAKKTVTVKLTPESEMRKLPPQLAQRIAFFLKSPEAGEAAATQGRENAAAAGRAAGRAGAGGRGGAGDFQQIINRLPAVTLADLQKDEAVMIVSTPGTGGAQVAAITLLSGVEPILTASPNAQGAAALLNGWNLSAPAEGGPQ